MTKENVYSVYVPRLSPESDKQRKQQIITGNSERVAKLKEGLQEKDADLIDFIDVDSRDEAVKLIKEREAYGAIIVAEDETTQAAPEIITSPAGSSAVNQMLTQLAPQLTAQIQTKAVEAQTAQLETVIAANQNPQATAQATAQLQAIKAQAAFKEATTVKTTQVTPYADSDSNGAGFNLAVSLPMTMAGMMGGVIALSANKKIWQRVLTVAVYGPLASLAITLTLHTWLEFVPGNFGAIWATITTAIWASSVFIIGLGALLPSGAAIGIGSSLNMLIANPISGVQAPWQFLAEPWGQIGQHMVPGAAANLLRSVAYFPDAATGNQWLTLWLWIITGIVLLTAGLLLQRTKAKKQAAPTEAN